MRKIRNDTYPGSRRQGYSYQKAVEVKIGLINEYEESRSGNNGKPDIKIVPRGDGSNDVIDRTPYFV